MAVGVVLAVLLVTACGNRDEANPGGGGDGTPSGLSNAYDLALTTTGPASFVLVDGAEREDGAVVGTSVYRITTDGSRIVADLDRPFRTPEAWSGPDGSVTIVGSECTEDSDVGPTCASSQIVVSVLADDGAEHTWNPGVRTDASVGFAAGPWGEDGLVVVSLDPTSRDARVHTVESVGADAENRGSIDFDLPAATQMCPVDDRTYLFPADLSGQPELLEVTDAGVEPAGRLGATMSDVTAVSGCSASGQALVSELIGGQTVYSMVSLHDPDHRRRVHLESPYDTGRLLSTDDGDVVVWVMTAEREDPTVGDQWLLARRVDDSWEPIGEVRSAEAPEKTAVGSDAAITIVQGPVGSTAKILER